MASAEGVPLIEIADLRKQYGGLRPLRLNALTVAPGERVTLRGLDAAAAEMLMLLVTGASLPDEGVVRICGRNTREIETDTQWLTSLDVFGMVTARAVLLDSLALDANLAVPLTLSIDPMPPDVRAAVEALAVEVGLDVAVLSARVGELSAASRVRVHLARALALRPQVLLLEHPTAALTPEEASAFGRQLSAVADPRKIGWLALTADESFASAAGGRQGQLVAASGQVREWRARRWGRFW
jgi:ABC-type transporter Mla maintaining outer membrane lipid asymmetry ATPase subunit MlaF